MEKSPEAFRTISEVATWLETPAHVLRFWESRFPEIAPVKGAGGRRYYRPEDMHLLGGIKHLLHTEGQTIKSVQERLKAEGPAAVSALSQPLMLDEAGDDTEADAATQDTPEPPTEDTAADTDARGRFASARAGGDEAPATPAGATFEANAEEAPRGPDELPPIGFFFDDSDDAAPPDDQSGTFSPLRDEADEADEPTERMEETAPSDGAPALPPLPDLPPDPDDAATLPGTPLPAACLLREVAPGDIDPARHGELRSLAERLEKLAAEAQ